MKTSVTKFLDDLKVDYTVKPHQKEAFTSEDAAHERGIRLSQIVKCMVGHDEHGNLYVMLIPGDRILKLKKVREVAGGVRIHLVPPDELVKTFGVTIGAISPVQFYQKSKIFMDHTIFEEDDVDISSGDLCAGIELKADKLCEILSAKRCDIVSTSHGSKVRLQQRQMLREGYLFVSGIKGSF
ncbi:MAG: YbaK/EbsC family protein [Magnetococcales bacterium]|nr:YbaK/EbsC family protein [Magnetococcales bacterium]